MNYQHFKDSTWGRTILLGSTMGLEVTVKPFREDWLWVRLSPGSPLCHPTFQSGGKAWQVAEAGLWWMPGPTSFIILFVWLIGGWVRNTWINWPFEIQLPRVLHINLFHRFMLLPPTVLHLNFKHSLSTLHMISEPSLLFWEILLHQGKPQALFNCQNLLPVYHLLNNQAQNSQQISLVPLKLLHYVCCNKTVPFLGNKTILCLYPRSFANNIICVHTTMSSLPCAFIYHQEWIVL